MQDKHRRCVTQLVKVQQILSRGGDFRAPDWLGHSGLRSLQADEIEADCDLPLARSLLEALLIETSSCAARRLLLFTRILMGDASAELVESHLDQRLNVIDKVIALEELVEAESTYMIADYLPFVPPSYAQEVRAGLSGQETSQDGMIHLTDKTNQHFVIAGFTGECVLAWLGREEEVG